jgi:hypothetical protein
LRARWYDPKIGGFISGDPFEGRQRDPRSLNRYVYAHGDPLHGKDPGGRTNMAETSFVAGNAAGGTATYPGIAVGAVTRVAAQLLRAGMKSRPLLKTLIQTCVTNPRDLNCLGELPTFILGNDYAGHTQFVALAQAATSPSQLTRTSRQYGQWYRATPECNGQTGGSTVSV